MANKKKDEKKFNFSTILFILLLGAIIFGIVYSSKGCSQTYTDVTYTEVYKLLDVNQKVKDGETPTYQRISSISITPQSDSNVAASYIVIVTVSNGSDKTVFRTSMNDTEEKEFEELIVTANKYIQILNDLDSDKSNDISLIKSSYVAGSTFNIWTVIFYGSMILGVVFIIVLIVKSSKANGGSVDQTFNFTKSKAKLNQMTTTKFDDVAGLDEEKQEMAEIVDFLKNPKKYTEMGARVPKGVLLYGKPGTGKTLLARAVAGEAGVPFFYTTGSDLVEMFVGVGASRVRDMFDTAKKKAPSILFMDEIDAIGRQRGTGLGGGNDEREQTLNQLLVEMDGFGQNSGVIVIAATNRPDILDPALLRPGRFDRQIDVSAPDIKGREEILKVHARNKKIDGSVDFKQIAHQTPGFTGADLENVMNESALLAARENKKVIDMALIGEAIDRVMMGPAKKSRIISPKEKEIIAYHEAGHCIIGSLLSNADVVQKVTIIPRGQAGGYNLMGPKEEETLLYSKSQLIERITGFLGGRTAEELIFGEITTGASNDMVNATSIARSMVCEYGMSKLGPITYEQNSGYVFLGRDYSSNKNFSDTVAHEIDEEVRSIINECHNNAVKILKENMDKLKAVAYYLLKVETLVKVDIDEILATGKLKRVDEENDNLKDLGTTNEAR